MILIKMQKAFELLPLLLIFILLLLSFKDYTQGFFLTRYEIHEKSEGGSSDPHYSKIILLLVDALRSDFVHPSNDSYFYSNHLSSITSLLTSNPNNSVLFDLISDPPTVTMQRVKALATGSLPTFIDFKDNLQSDSITEDNLIHQAKVHHKRTLFVGDQIWVFLLPDTFTLAYPFDSHNVRDLDTVDNGVKDKFRKHLQEDWDLIVGHMLGVDHVAHRYQANHAEMQRKLKEVNEFIWEIVNGLKTDELFVLIGDHGMTDEGNHGGATLQETQTVLFAYSRKGFVKSTEKRKKLAQIDVVPTISVLMGLPIPFNNLGTIIPELFHNSSLITESLYSNAKQVSKYLETYDTKVKKLPDEVYEKIQVKFLDIRKAFSEGKTLTKEIFSFIEEAGRMCRDIWTTFDYFVMTRSLISVLLGTFAGVILLIYTINPVKPKDLAICLILAPIDYSLSFAYLIYQINSRSLSKNLNEHFKAVLLFNFLYGYTLFSDSYIVKQDQVLRFLSQLMLAHSCLKGYSHYHLISSLCIRLSSTFDIYTQTSSPTLLYHPLLITYLPLLFLLFQSPSLLYKSNLILISLYWSVPQFNVQVIPKAVYLIFFLNLRFERSKWSILPVLLILSGAQSAILFVLAVLQVYSARKVLVNEELFGTFLSFTAGQYFYATGHRCNIQSLRISSAFIGFDEYIFWINGILLSLNTLAAYFVVLECRREREVKYFMIHFLVAGCCTLANTFVNGRHLMVWSVFAPKFIFDSIVMFVVWIVALAGLGKLDRREENLGEDGVDGSKRDGEGL